MNNNSLVVVKGNFLNKIDCTPFKTLNKGIVGYNSLCFFVVLVLFKFVLCSYSGLTTLEGLQ